MKTTIKRFSGLLLSGLMTLSVLTACGESVELLSFLDKEVSGYDLDGFVCTIAQSINSDNTGVVIDENNPFGYKENTEFADAALARMSNISKELNCEIELSIVSSGGAEMLSMALADNVYQDVLYSPSHGLMKSLSMGGVLEKVTDYGDYIDYKNTDKYGAANIQEMNSYNGEIHAVSPISWMFKQPRALELIVINEDIRSQYNMPNPKEYIEKGEWNWDGLEDFIAGSSYFSDDISIYSMAVRGFDMVKLLAYGNGFNLAYETEDGFASDYGEANMVEAAQFYYDLRSKYSQNFVYNKEIDWPEILDSFAIQQNSVSCLTAAQVLYNDIIYEVENYSVVPFPTGPRGEYGKWPSAIESTDSFSVFRTADNPELNFLIIDKLCEPFEGYVTDEERFDYISTNVLYTAEDANYTLNTYKNGVYTLMCYYVDKTGFDELWREFERGANGKLNKTVTVVIDSLRDIYLEMTEEFVVPNFAIYEQLSDQ